MRLRRWSINTLVIIAFVLAQFSAPAAGLAHESEPSPAAGACVPDAPPDESGADTLNGIVREESGLTQVDVVDPDANVIAGWSLLCAEVGASADPLMQEGQILLDVLQGGMTLTLTKPCGAESCTTTTGEMRVGDVGHRLPERISRFAVAGVARDFIVADAVLAEISVGVASAGWTIGGHLWVFLAYLARLAMPGMTAAPLAVLAQGDAIRIVAL